MVIATVQIIMVERLQRRSANASRPMWEKFLLGAGTLAVIVILYDGVTGAGIINFKNHHLFYHNKCK